MAGLHCHFILGETACNPQWVERAPTEATGGFNACRTWDPWPAKEGWLQTYLCSWSHEDHQGCGCRRSRARITSFLEHPYDEEDQFAGDDIRFPDSQGWYRRRETNLVYPWSSPLSLHPSDLPNQMRRWGTTQCLILEDMIPAYIKNDVQVCSWDEAWGGGETPYTPSTITNPFVPAYPSRSPWFQRGPAFESMERRRGAPMLRPARDVLP
jgi:hypothetical protein